MENSPIRKKRGFDPDYEHAQKAKKWLLENHARYEEMYGLPKGALVALAGHESRFDPYARSWSGAQGLFQFTEKTARGYGLKVGGEDDERFNLEKATDAAARYLANNMKHYEGNLVSSIAQWNGGWKAGDAVRDGKIKEFVSPNGTRELDGFLTGVKNTAKQYGFNDIYNQIAAVYGENPIEQPEQQVDNSKKKVHTEQAMVNAPINEYIRRRALAERFKPVPLVVSAKTPSNQPKPGYDDYDFLDQIDQQYRILKHGGSLLQMSGDKKTVEAVLKGSERIYSRKDTERLMGLAKKAKTADDFFLLGKFLYDATKKQDARPPEFTDE